MKRIDLTRYGFVRSKDEDFSDDGTRFTCYRVGRVRVSKATWRDQVYLHGRIDDGKLDYAEYSKLPHHDEMDRLNGVCIAALQDDDLRRFYEDCVSYSEEYDAAEKAIVMPTEAELKARCDEIADIRYAELDDLMMRIKAYSVELLMKASQYDIERLRGHVDTIRRNAEYFSKPGLAKELLEEDGYTARRLFEPDCSELKDSYAHDAGKKIVGFYS